MAAQYQPLSKHIVYTSRAGCPAITNTASPQSGPNASAALQALANLASPSGPYPGGPLEIVVDQPLLVYNVSLYSGTTIRGLSPASYVTGVPAYGLWQATSQGTQSCILKNANWRSPYQGGTIVDQDITIKDLYLDGQFRNSSTGNPATNPALPAGGSTSNTNGQFVVPLQLYGINNLLCQNLYIYDMPCYGIHAANVFSAKFRDITGIDVYQVANPTNSTYTGRAVLQFCGPWGDVLVDGIYGTTGDDMLAFNMADGNLANSTAQQQFGGYSTVYYGSGGNTVARRLRPTNCLNVIRILYGSDPAHNGTNPTILSSILIEDVAGSVISTTLSGQPDTHFGGGSGGSVTELTIKDMALTIATGGVPSDALGFNIPPVTGNVLIDNVKWQDLGSSTTAHQINFSGACNEVTLRDYKIYEDSSEVATPNPMVLIASGNTVGGITLEGCKWIRNANTAQAMLSMTGGTLTRGIKLVGVEADNINNVVSITGGTLGSACSIDSAGLTHQNANSNPSISIGTGVTLPRLRAGASNTIQLQAGSGTVTSKKTDSTEDS